MSDSQGRPTSPKLFTEIEVLSQDPELPQEEDPEVLPVYPYQGKPVFRAKEMGDYFISQLQQQHDEFNDFKSNTVEREGIMCEWSARNILVLVCGSSGF